MGKNNVIFLEVIEWFDETGKEIAHRVPEAGSGEIKYGAQLIVRESQAAVFFYQGKAFDAVGAGRHTLTTLNVPVITKILSLPWGFTSPLRAEVYFTNMKVFPNLTWGTRDPVAFKDSRLGLIRLRAFGVFNIQVIQPTLFVNTLVGTRNTYTISDIEEYLGSVIVSRLNDYLGEKLETVFDLPGQYDAISEGLRKILEQDFSRFGLMLSNLYINSITPPLEVQKAIDDKSRLAIFDDLNKLLQMKAAMAIESASQQQGGAGAGLGMGLGFMMPAMFAESLKKTGASVRDALKCPDCGNPISEETNFCPFCGHQLLIYQQCVKCRKNIPPHGKFCPSCGEPASQKQVPVKCTRCGTENLAGSAYCNQCGEKI